MAELYFLRHGQRIDHALAEDPNAKPIVSDYQPYDPSLATSAIDQIKQAAEDIASTTKAFDSSASDTSRKNIFIHFSPYLRCCQSGDMLVTDLKALLLEKFPQYKVRFQLLGDFALSEWIHDKMRDKPPFIDSNDAYNMYTPNIKLLKNKSACSNFRPTNTLGPFNGPDLSYKDYQARCKSYFEKLLATYDKPAYMKNKDIIIIISHGYVINNFISYFINHPIFDEIPEAKINYAERVAKEDVDKDLYTDEDPDPSNYTWKLQKDALGMFSGDDVDTTLNLGSDIVYYQTNFIKRDEVNNRKPSSLKLPTSEVPRPSFKIESTKDNHNNSKVIRNYNPLCPAAKDWAPQKVNSFLIKSEFKLKVMNDESFKKSFDLTHHPTKPVSPEVSPNSEPTRSNSVIDLSKLTDNNDIYKPMKLKYSFASEVPIHKLNSKVNSQVNLAQSLRGYGSSNDSSSVDLPKHLSIMGRNRSSSNPVVVAHGAKDSYFPSTIVSKIKSSGSDYSIDSNNDDLHIIKEHQNEPLQLNRANGNSSPHPPPPLPPLVNEINRSRSLNRRTGSKSLLARYQKTHQHNDSDESDDNMQNRMLSFSPQQHTSKTDTKKGTSNGSSPVTRTRSRKNSIKFVPSVLNYDKSSSNLATSPITNDDIKSPKDKSPPNRKSIFYHLNSDDSITNSESESDSESDEPNDKGGKKKNQYIWFGQNRD